MSFGTSPSQSSSPVHHRALWIVLTALFATLFLWRLYSFSQGEEPLHRIWWSAGMLLMSSAQLLSARQGLFHKLVLVASLVLLLVGAVSFALVEGA